MARLLSGPAVTGFAAGLVGGMVALSLFPKANMRPAAKGALRAALQLYERGREAAATLAETTSDLVAEIQEERARDMLPAELGATVTPIKAAAPSAADA